MVIRDHREPRDLMKFVNKPLGTEATHRAYFPHADHDLTSPLESTEVWPPSSLGAG